MTMSKTPANAPTPTGHSTRATFFGLELECSASTDLAEDSSVDCSNFLDGSSAMSGRLLTPRDTAIATSRQLAALPEEAEGSVSTTNPNGHENTTTGSSTTPRIDTTTANRNGVDVSQGATLNILNDLQESQNQSKVAAKVGLCTVPDNETGHTSIFLSKMDSKTLHASNVHSHSISKRSEPQVVGEVYDAMPDDERIAAWAIHIALGVFMFLVIVIAILSYVTVQKYGAITFFFVFNVVVFCLFLAMFVDRTVLSKHPQLKPIRRKIGLVVQAAKQAVVDEYQLFRQEWKEHTLLLKDGVAEDDDDEEDDEEEREQPTGVPEISIPKRKKSVIFRLVKPFVGIPRKLFRRRKKKSKNKKTSSKPEESYMPPAETSIV